MKTNILPVDFFGHRNSFLNIWGMQFITFFLAFD